MKFDPVTSMRNPFPPEYVVLGLSATIVCGGGGVGLGMGIGRGVDTGFGVGS